MKYPAYFLSAPAVVTAQGCSREALAEHLLHGAPLPLSTTKCFEKIAPTALVTGRLPEIAEPEFKSRVNQLILACLQQMRDEISQVQSAFPRERIAIVLGNSNTAIREMELEVAEKFANPDSPQTLNLPLMSLSNPTDFMKKTLDVGGPAIAISTACSSAGKAFATAQEMLANDICDAVFVGGADSFSPFVQGGFDSLGIISENQATPLARSRDGINIGEGAAIFVMTREPLGNAEKIQLLAVGESSDAYHITSPDPDGNGAAESMRNALANANLVPADIDYINLHGTGTPGNDSMESRAVRSVFGEKIPLCSSSKAFFGHTLGASGAVEAALCWLALSEKYNPQNHLPFHPQIGETDEDTSAIPRVPAEPKISVPAKKILSNSFAFGGSNVSVIFGKN